MICQNCQFEDNDGMRYCRQCGALLRSSEDTTDSHPQNGNSRPEPLTPGTTYADRYQIIEKLGEGGMGRVYKVFDAELKEVVCLKLINSKIASQKKTIDRFQNEIRLARRISHKNICRVYHLSEEQGDCYMIMEYVPGRDLKSVIKMTRELSIATAIRIGKQVCDGLSEAHRRGVIHRDLKPSNILIDREGNVRIMDFGIASSVKTKGLTGAGVMIGTPEYMSPEQAEAKAVDHRSDIYSLGIVLYEIYVSENDGPFTRWLTATTASSAGYPGTGGAAYRFYSVAVDGVGFREAAPAQPDAATTVVNAIYLPLVLRN